MSKIEVSINVESTKELKELLAELSGTLTNELTVSPMATEVEPKEEKKSAPKKATSKKAPVKKEEKASTDSTSEKEPSKPGKAKEPIKDNEPTKSVTQGKYPDATKADVQKAMKKAMGDGKREAILTCFERFNASKLSQLKKEDYSAFLTDLEVLVGD